MKKNNLLKIYIKHRFLVLNFISFAIALIDGFIWRNASVGFPIFTLAALVVVAIISWIDEIIRLVKNPPNHVILKLIFLWFTVPFYGTVGAIGGLVVGLTLFG